MKYQAIEIFCEMQTALEQLMIGRDERAVAMKERRCR